jgi:hypothetical protein
MNTFIFVDSNFKWFYESTLTVKVNKNVESLNNFFFEILFTVVQHGEYRSLANAAVIPEGISLPSKGNRNLQLFIINIIINNYSY